MNDALVSLGRLYGLSAEETARIGLKAPFPVSDAGYLPFEEINSTVEWS